MLGICPSCGSSNVEELTNPDPTCFDSENEAVAVCQECGEPLAANEVFA